MPKHVYKYWRTLEENFLFAETFSFDWDILLRNKSQLIICWFSHRQHTAPSFSEDLEEETFFLIFLEYTKILLSSYSHNWDAWYNPCYFEGVVLNDKIYLRDFEYAFSKICDN